MLTISHSPSAAEISGSHYEWPMTTLPWVVATARDATDGADPALRTFTGTSGLRVAGWMTAKRWAFLSAECYLLEDGEWTGHRVAEVFLGHIGKANTPVAVFRDAHGVDFCPDAPEVPPTALADLKLVCTISPSTPFRAQVDEVG